MKKLLTSDLTNTIYLTNAKQDKNNPSLYIASGEKQDFTDQAIAAVFQWFINNMKSFKDGKTIENEEYSVIYKGQPYALKMVRKPEENDCLKHNIQVGKETLDNSYSNYVKMVDKLQVENEQLKASQPVRCGGCKYYHYLDELKCDLCNKVILLPDDYCSYGERRIEK